MSGQKRKSARDRPPTEDKITVRNSATKLIAFAKHSLKRDQIHKTADDDHVPNTSDESAMRIILPVFIENEQRYAQMERVRKVQSSPAKAMRRFSQNSTTIERIPIVSQLIVKVFLFNLFLLNVFDTYTFTYTFMRNTK